MKKLKRAALILACAVIMPLYDQLLPAGTPAPGGPSRIPSYAVPGKYDSYSAAWSAVRVFDGKSKPRSAMEEVDTILARAKKEHNVPQIVKAQIHRVKYIMAIGEKEHPDILRMLEKETASAALPEKQILSSLLAEAYCKVFENLREIDPEKIRKIVEAPKATPSK